MSEEEKMLRKWIQNHKQLISEAPDEKQRELHNHDVAGIS